MKHNYDLKQCPFCGGLSKIVDIHGKTGHSYRVYCTKCQIRTFPERLKWKAVKLWNKRSPNEN